MAGIKWIKVYTNMVSNKKIKRIRTLPEGNNIVLIWVFLIAQAGESNKDGALYLTDTIPFRPEDLAVEFDFEISVINLALITLEKFSMIEVFEEVIYIKNWSEYQNIEGLEKIREQTRLRNVDYRGRKKLALLGEAQDSCVYCGREGVTIDHIVPRSKNGKDIPSNLVNSCKSCNSSKKDKDLADFLNDSYVMEYQKVDHELVRRNEKLMTFVEYNELTKLYRHRDATVTQGDAIELDKDKEVDIELDKEKKIDIVPYKEIVEYLNHEAGTKYKSSSRSTREHIHARWEDGFKLDDFRSVIDKKVASWTGTDQEKYLRPETLFGTKFEGYVNEKVKQGGYKGGNNGSKSNAINQGNSKPWETDPYLADILGRNEKET